MLRQLEQGGDTVGDRSLPSAPFNEALIGSGNEYDNRAKRGSKKRKKLYC